MPTTAALRGRRRGKINNSNLDVKAVLYSRRLIANLLSTPPRALDNAPPSPHVDFAIGIVDPQLSLIFPSKTNT